MTGRRRVWPRRILTALLALCVPLLLLLAAGSLGARTDAEGLRRAEEGIRRAAVQCYALEGFYPRSADYLAARYGVAVDPARYFVDYQYVASNLMPEVTVLPAGGR